MLMTPTDKTGKNFSQERRIDLAALDLFRDRDRGIQKFNEFRRSESFIDLLEESPKIRGSLN